MVKRLKKLISQRLVIKGLVVKNLKDKYVGSSLGIFWSILNPLLIMLVITFIFTNIMKTEVKNYPLAVLATLLPWFFFVNSLTEASSSLRDKSGILNQFIMPPESIPISLVLANFINFLFGFIVLLPVFIIFNPGIIKYLPFLPIILVLHFAFTLGISLTFSVIAVYFKDLQQLLNVGLMFMFWITPVFYTLEMIPEAYRWIIRLNPVTGYSTLYRVLLYQGASGGAGIWLEVMVFSIISLTIGYFLFIKNESAVLKYI